MLKKLFFILLILFTCGLKVICQPLDSISIHSVKEELKTEPGKIVNIPVFTTNNTTLSLEIITKISLPANWKVITYSKPEILKPKEKKFSIISIQVPSSCKVGENTLHLNAINYSTKQTLHQSNIIVSVLEKESISMQLIESPENIVAGETYKALFQIQNSGNTTKKIFIETTNCDIEGPPEVELKPGESSQITVFKQTSEELTKTRQEYFTVRSVLSGTTLQNIFFSTTIFPAKSTKKDLYHRFPITASATYLSTNVEDKYQSAFQFEISGNGTLDPEGKHNLEFLAVGPNQDDLSFLGTHDQYYVSYSSKNAELTVGELTYSFTPLTESSRFGLGVEGKAILNNGLSFGYTYLKPRFYEGISNEMAAFTRFEKNRNNSIEFYSVIKKYENDQKQAYLASLNTEFQPFEKTNLEIELSRGTFQGTADNAIRAHLNTQFSIFRLSGNYNFAGKYYPGYFSNATFYSGTFSAQLTKNINAGLNARQDFRNAELDTFYVTAPYSKSFQSFLNLHIAPRSYLKFYWREYEKKDRLALDKFHYKTKSINSTFNQKFNKTEYYLLGEIGKTTNFLLDDTQNVQNTYRASANWSYRFNSMHRIRFFGTWSNINSFVTGEQRNVTAGLSINSKITKNLKANFRLQNAYDIDDYYRNRNLMQLNLDYKIHKQHSLALRSYYTIFKQEVDNPEFYLSATYTYQLGLPVKQIIKAGDLRGRVTNTNGEPVEGIILNLHNKKDITNKDGEFSFNSVQPGKALLFINRSNLAIDELPNIPNPLELEIIEDRETTLNFQITKGAKLTGRFYIGEGVAEESSNRTENLIVALKSEFKQYRTTSDKDGKFSFPMVQPGPWSLEIYTNSVPDGLMVENKILDFELVPNERKNVEIELKQKKKNIIFKSQSFSLSSNKKISSPPEKESPTNKNFEINKNESDFYSIQIGAFKRKLQANSTFFKDVTIDFEIYENNLYKYFVGYFKTMNEASIELKKLQSKYKSAFIVVFNDERLQYINEQKQKNLNK